MKKAFNTLTKAGQTRRINAIQKELEAKGLENKLVSVVSGLDHGVVDGKDGNQYHKFAYRAVLCDGSNKFVWLNELIKVNDRTTGIIASRQQMIDDLKSKKIKSQRFSANMKAFNADNYDVDAMFLR